jgi:predicted 3-demethylubiquinone-9 3-methyltransferase (glyoxalase superfamily)
MQKIVPFLWFDDQAEEAAELYTSILPDSRILNVSRYGEVAPGETGTVMTVELELLGQRFVALNGGPAHAGFTQAVSFQVPCETQEEVDRLWDALTADGGEESMCGWLKDRFGLSWQITPTALPRLLGDPDRERAERAMAAMMQMRKLDIAELERAADGVRG